MNVHRRFAESSVQHAIALATFAFVWLGIVSSDGDCRTLYAAPPDETKAASGAVPTDDVLFALGQLDAIGSALHQFQSKYYALAPNRFGENVEEVAVKSPMTTSPADESPEDKEIEELLKVLRTPKVPAAMQPTRLSWRVHILAFMGPSEVELYEKFRLDESWDSPHNRKLLDEMPKIYRFKDAPGSKTRFQVVQGPGLLFGAGRPPKSFDLEDGERNTILLLLTGADKAVPWTQPDDLAWTPQTPIANLGLAPREPIVALSANSEWIVLPGTISPQEFRGFCTPAGREVVDADLYQQKFESRMGESLKNSVMKRYGRAPKWSLRHIAATPAGDRFYLEQQVTKLKRLALGMHSYHDHFRRFPPVLRPEYIDPTGKPYLSWRVHLLPMLDQKPLYDQFKLNEPWDSPHNRNLLAKMPTIFRHSRDASDVTTTRFQTISGPKTLFQGAQGIGLNAVTDGTDKTILIVQTSVAKAVPWTKPDDLVFDAKAPLACLGDLGSELIYCAFADGRVRALKPTIPPDVFRAMVTIDGGERLPPNVAEFEME